MLDTLLELAAVHSEIQATPEAAAIVFGSATPGTVVGRCRPGYSVTGTAPTGVAAISGTAEALKARGAAMDRHEVSHSHSPPSPVRDTVCSDART